MVSAPGPVHVQGCKKPGKSRCWILPVIWCLSWFSSGLCPEPISLYHCVRGSIQTVPYRLSMGDGKVEDIEHVKEGLICE